VEKIAKGSDPLADESRMALDDYSFCAGNLLGDWLIIRERDRGGIEKTAAIVQLDLLGTNVKALEGVINLFRDSSDRDGLG